MKRYGLLACLAYAILAAAAVWLGGLNQDEGWYLYAARMVGEGNVLYRDFFYTQGPLMPILYAPLAWVWRDGGLLGARILTAALGLVGMVFAAALARLLAPQERKDAAGIIAFLLLGCNLYHVYYTAIPKTYALAALFVMMGFYLLGWGLADRGRRLRRFALFVAGLSLAFAAGTRISLGLLLAVCGFALLFACRRLGWSFLWFGLGGALGLAVVYGPFLCDPAARAGLCAAQAYHAARGGFDIVFTVGSVSRLVRGYLPVLVLLGMGVAVLRPRLRDLGLMGGLLGVGFLAVTGFQLLAPFPYEDYQVPVMGLLAVLAAVAVVRGDARPQVAVLLTLGMTWAASFGSPLLEEWMTNGRDRFWPLKKDRSELAQLQDAAAMIERLDPGGRELLTQDLYLAIETGRKVPKGLEMGPFSILSDAEWVALLESAPCPVAAMSGYSFAINPPRCDERPLADQVRYWDLLRKHYELVFPEAHFGQNATTLLVLKRKTPPASGENGGTP
ncbi:MAG: ArnT family glycosyltransferase [Kiritimatiellia bacterium]